jgi:hypothetical protein
MREALIIHATTPPVKARLTRHYESRHRREYAASVAEARRIAGLDPPEGHALSPAYPVAPLAAASAEPAGGERL